MRSSKRPLRVGSLAASCATTTLERGASRVRVGNAGRPAMLSCAWKRSCTSMGPGSRYLAWAENRLPWFSTRSCAMAPGSNSTGITVTGTASAIGGWSPYWVTPASSVQR